jgi:hypothetical protein
MYYPRRQQTNFGVVAREQALLRRHYDFLRTEIRSGVLYCYGQFQPSVVSTTYDFRITYDPKRAPKVHVREPRIAYNKDIHMYKDGNLCLYFPPDMNWTSDCHLFNTIVPWTQEWFVFYELYQISGKWEHPFVPHGTI